MQTIATPYLLDLFKSNLLDLCTYYTFAAELRVQYECGVTRSIPEKLIILLQLFLKNTF